jgi:hypothetical protein
MWRRSSQEDSPQVNVFFFFEGEWQSWETGREESGKGRRAKEIKAVFLEL